MINRIFRLFFSSMLILGCLAVRYYEGSAQTNEEANFISFKDLGKQEILIEGPIGAESVKIVLPSYWTLQTGSLLHLNMRVFVGGQADTPTAAANIAAGYLELYFNDIWLTNVPIEKNGETSVDIPVPDDAWITTPANYANRIKFILHDSIRCSTVYSAAINGNWRSLTVAIHPSSYIYVPHQDAPVLTDLKALPAPIYEDTFLPNKALLVIPDTPSRGELQAAVTVSAALGRMSNGKLDLTMSTISQADPQALNTMNVIFVGNPAAFPLLDNAGLPAPVSGRGFSNTSIGRDDGVLQLVVSPKDKTKSWFIVSGHSDDGMIKAAQAVASSDVRPFGPDNLAIVTGVANSYQAAYSADFTLENLGYSEQTFTGFGTNYFTFYFDVPFDRQVSDGAFLELDYNNSAVVNYQESDITITLNDQFVGGVRLSDRSTSTTTAKFTIPSYFLHAGQNLLLLQMDLSSMTPCAPADSNWISIKPSTHLHLPSVPTPDDLQVDASLTRYPSFLFPTFQQTAFVVSTEDPSSWIAAGKIAYDLGRSISGTIVNPTLAYSTSLPQDFLKNTSFIIIGRPSKLDILKDLSTSMPAPFMPGSDVSVAATSQFTYATPETDPIGYLEVFPSPYNTKYIGLTVLANNDTALLAAANALITSALRDNLNGNLAVVYHGKITASNVVLEAPEPQATLQVEVQNTVEQKSNQAGPFQIDLVILTAIIVGFLVILGLVVMFVNGWKKKKLKKE